MEFHSIAFFTWGIQGDAFTSIIASLCHGFSTERLDSIYVVYLKESEKNLKSRFPDNVKFISLDVNRSSFSVLAFKKFIESYKPDLIVCMPTIINIPALIAWLWSRKKNSRTKIIISEHAILSYETKVEYRHVLKMRLLPLFAKFLYPMASGIVANNQSIIDDLMKQGIRIELARSAIIPNPLDINSVKKLSIAVPEHHWLRQNKVPVLLGVGRLAKQKNWLLLLKAAVLILKEINIKLIILGEGPERSHLQNTANSLRLADIVDFPGFQVNPYAWMASADVLVLPSQEESFGLVIIEAMACGIPVVAVDALGGGPRILTDDGKYGVLVKDDAQSLKDAIVKVLCDDKFRESLTQSASAHAGCFSIESVTQQWISFIMKL